MDGASDRVHVRTSYKPYLLLSSTSRTPISALRIFRGASEGIFDLDVHNIEVHLEEALHRSLAGVNLTGTLPRHGVLSLLLLARNTMPLTMLKLESTLDRP